MKTKLSPKWMPPESVLSLAKSKGMPIEDWLYHLIPEFKLYWIDCGETKKSWGSTFWNHAKDQWEKVDKSRLYREQPNFKPDLPTQNPNPINFVPHIASNLPSAEALSIERFEEQCKEWNTPQRLPAGND